MSSLSAPLLRTLTEHTYPATTGSVSEARHSVADALTRHGVSKALREDIVLAAGEVITNAVKHGPGGKFTVDVYTAPELIRVEVTDEGTATIPTPRDAADLSEHGRGLAIVVALADRLGWTRECGEAPGMTVHFEFSRPELP